MLWISQKITPWFICYNGMNSWMNLKIREIFHDHAMDAIYHFILIYVVHFNGLYSNGYYRETIGVDMETKDILYEDNIVDSSIQSTSIACMRHCKRLSQTCYNFGYNEETRQCHLYDVLSMTGQTKHEQGWRYTAMGGKCSFTFEKKHRVFFYLYRTLIYFLT